MQVAKSSAFCVVQVLRAEKEAHEKIASSSDKIFVLRCKLVCNCNPYCVHSIIFRPEPDCFFGCQIIYSVFYLMLCLPLETEHCLFASLFRTEYIPVCC
jgi:hypothetical protein